MAEQDQSELLAWIARATWLDGSDVETEYLQAQGEGRNLSAVEGDFARLIAAPNDARDENWLREARALVDRVQELPARAGYAYDEPSDLTGIQQARPAQVVIRQWTGNTDTWRERLHGGLLGRICGCMLGKPVETWDRASMQAMGEATGNWTLADYWRAPSDAEAAQLPKGARRFDAGHAPTLSGTIDGMVEDDDINYTTVGYAVVRKYGPGFRPLDVASYWCDCLPIFHTCTAERVAYRNIVGNVLPPESASRRNPYREWIGAQIRADYFGYANPGDPERAAEWAWRDACISHVKNGIFGEMWVAAMLAAAYVETDWVTIIRAGLAQVPAQCRLREDVEKMVALRGEGASYDEAVAAVHAQWDEKRAHDWCHTNSNAQIVAIGLLWGDDDYETTITRAVMPGFDTDCNGATCGSLWGVAHGLAALPAKWTWPMNDTVRTGVAGYHSGSISKLAADMIETAGQARR